MTTDARLSERRHRTAAAVLVSLVATTVAAAVHAAAGGGVPSVAGLAVALLFSVAIGMLAIGPRLTRGRTAVGVLLDQLVFHSVFAFFGPASAAATATPAHAHAHEPAPLVAIVAPGAAAAPEAVMAISHLAAAVVAYGMLRSGIRAVETVLRALGRALTRALALPGPAAVPAAPRMAAPAPVVGALRAAHRRLADGRAPPALAVA